MKIAEIVKRIEQSHQRSLAALAAYHRSGAGTATARKHYERYERNSELFNQSVAQLKTEIDVNKEATNGTLRH